ncbi:uncharacterized protein LOC110919826 isoform X3 [Helianthus annuus]|uniref:uncharacterized protein LOC110919826 isoform X3 n=1 Tax=Helianthus annuus TaxID=4232 RepID=UPI001652ECA4|nr:uncharacterized protein LOC110919826 isoform X3 [Helianthus annuus]XP_035841249.1 uncharacterized protein LOC110919826 isoform X3 [Helianthus annuus]
MLRLYLQWLRWNSALHYHPPVYAPAALSMNFLLLDLGLFPNTAARFGISLEEVSRFPDMHPAAKSSDITKIDYCDMNNLLQPIFHMLACSYLFQYKNCLQSDFS